MMTIERIERSLKPSQALALDIVRNNPMINRYQADIHLGHGSLTQRVSELVGMGFVIQSIKKPYCDLQGNEHQGVAHYLYLGWKTPNESIAA